MTDVGWTSYSGKFNLFQVDLFPLKIISARFISIKIILFNRLEIIIKRCLLLNSENNNAAVGVCT